TGDPLFYGVARYLCDKIGKDYFDVIPHVSSMQLAFARVKESWEEAYLTDVGNRSLDDVLDRIRTSETVGLFTANNMTLRPSRENCLLAGSTTFALLSVKTSAGQMNG